MQGRSWSRSSRTRAEFAGLALRYYEFPDGHKVRPQRGVRTETWKLIHYYDEPQEFELYDLEQIRGRRSISTGSGRKSAFWN